MGPFYNIIFCVFACDTIEQYRNEILKVKETWGKDPKALKSPLEPTVKEPKPTEKDQSESYKVLFFLGETGPFIGEDYIHLENVDNDYMSASYKQYGGLEYIYNNYDFNYIFICGTDTYVCVERLIEYINSNPQITPNKPLVFGGHGDTRNICKESVYFFSGGAGIVLTKKTMEIIYPELKTMHEEWLWICGENGYITYAPACDLALCYFLKRNQIVFMNVANRFFNCNYMGCYNNRGTYISCCESIINHKTIVSCHNMTLVDFDAFTAILQSETPFVKESVLLP